MNYSEVIAFGVILGLSIAISVGPTLFAVIRYSMHHTYKAGIAFILGVSLSDIMFVTIVNVATEFLSFLATHQRTIGIIGSSLFMALGLFSFLKKYKPVKPSKGVATDLSGGTYLKILLSGWAMNTFNPAVVVIWVGVAVNVATYTVMEKLLLFGICLGIVLIFDFAKVFLSEKIRSWLTLRKIMYINKISALFIFIFGFALLMTMLFSDKYSG